MLIKIYCEKFRTREVEFHAGLNSILGDHAATNSIGKSSLLMVIDFAFGGDGFSRHNQDVPKELGHHDYHFLFRFGDEFFRFVRNTYTPGLVHRVADGRLDEYPMKIEDYREFLKRQYALDDVNMTFRSIVSPFSRVWGKENLDVKHPLHLSPKQKASVCVDNLIKLYKQYDEIEALHAEVEALSSKKATVSKAHKQQLIPKSTLAKHRENQEAISRIDAEIQDIKENLAKYAISINEIVNREVSELKATRDTLVGERDRLSMNLSRVRRDLGKNKHIKSKAFKSLEKYFPSANLERLAEVETFHSQIAKILRDELNKSEAELLRNLSEVELAIENVDQEMSNSLRNISQPTAIVDRVHELARRRSDAKREIEYHELESSIVDGLRKGRSRLTAMRNDASSHIANIINNKIRKLVDLVYDERRKSPRLEINGAKYSFSAIEDTGTGKAYSNLILLDIAVLQTTVLPFIIHDSVLFKNIENEAVARLIEVYNLIGRQTFVSIDEIHKYGAVAESILNEKKVIQLSNESQLYIKDWRN